MGKTEEDRLAELMRRDAPDERWDIYDAAGRRTGRVQRRGDPLKEGDYHLCVHVWIRDGKGRYLLTKRAPEKYMAGRWEAPGGSALTGEDSLAAALREVKEETGLALDPGKGEVLFRFSGDHFHCDVWRFVQAVDLAAVRLLPGETVDARLASADEIRALEREGGMFSFDYLPRVLEG